MATSKAAKVPTTAHEWLQDALGRYQVTHIHSSIREAIKAMELTEEAPAAPPAEERPSHD